MRKEVFATVLSALLALSATVRAADHLQLNPKLDYNTDSQDGPLITGEHLGEGVVAGATNYVIIYAEACFNSKRQARRSVQLYEQYKNRVHFVVVDLDQPRSTAQQELTQKYYRGLIPHVVVLDRSGKPVYNDSGEVSSGQLSRLFDKLLRNR